MNREQMKKYRAEWGKVVRLLRSRGFSDDEIERERIDIKLDELGSDKPSRECNDGDVDKLLAACAALLHPADLDLQMRLREGGRRRLVRGIEEAGFGDEYVATIARRVFKVSDWRNLDREDLRRLRTTLTQRARAAKRREGSE